ncbi:MAG: crossover junction endodeoxyribonuclease RuvC [Bacteroidota bacterium]
MKHLNVKRILGVDPGTNVLGYAIVEIVETQMRVLGMGTIRMTKYDTHPEKLKHIFEGLQEIIEHYKPSEMAVEAPFHGKNVQSMLKLGRAQGVAMAAAMVNNVEVHEYPPKKIKVGITGNGNASKEQVLSMLENILKIKLAEQPLDATDALAAAVCHHYQSNNPLTGNKKFKDWNAFLKENPGRKA